MRPGVARHNEHVPYASGRMMAVPMRIADGIRASTSLLAAGLPLLERSFEVLPVTRRVREDVLPAAVIATLLCVVAGYATSRNSFNGLAVGWPSLVLFLGVVVALFGFAELIPRGDSTTLRITENGEVYNPVFRFVSRFVFGHSATIEKYLADVRKVARD